MGNGASSAAVLLSQSLLLPSLMLWTLLLPPLLPWSAPPLPCVPSRAVLLLCRFACNASRATPPITAMERDIPNYPNKYDVKSYGARGDGSSGACSLVACSVGLQISSASCRDVSSWMPAAVVLLPWSCCRVPQVA